MRINWLLNFVKKLYAVKHASVIDWISQRVVSCFFLFAIGAIEVIIKCNRGNGTKFVWNSFKSTFNSPSNLNAHVIDDIGWLINRFILWIRISII